MSLNRHQISIAAEMEIRDFEAIAAAYESGTLYGAENNKNPYLRYFVHPGTNRLIV
jgi:hypothetical protein